MNTERGAGLDEIKRGYSHVCGEGVFRCLFCGREYIEGDIYVFGERMVEARSAIGLHIRGEHGSVFDALIANDKKVTGLTGAQAEIMSMLYAGLSDKEIAAETGTSPSTVRFRRYNLREKARQARVFLALFELMEERAGEEALPEVHSGATMVDERYMTTDGEERQIIASCFASTEPPVLKTFPHKQKKKLVILRFIAGRFERGRVYSEREVNEVIRAIYADNVTIRRYLIEYGFMERTPNGSEYRLK